MSLKQGFLIIEAIASLKEHCGENIEWWLVCQMKEMMWFPNNRNTWNETNRTEEKRKSHPNKTFQYRLSHKTGMVEGILDKGKEIKRARKWNKEIILK